MGTWGHRAFDNDTAGDWAYRLEEANDLSVVEAAFAALDAADGYVDQDVACEALAACEVIARLLGRPGYRDAYTETVDAWVKAHGDLKPSPALLARAEKAIDRVVGKGSELADLWVEDDERKWRAEVDELSRRLKARGAR